MRICFDHGGVNNRVSLDTHPASALNLVENFLSFLNLTVFHTGINQTAKRDVVICRIRSVSLESLVSLV